MLNTLSIILFWEDKLLTDSDLRILRIMEEDGTLSYADIGRRLGLDESTVRKRIIRLKDGGVIKKMSVVIDPDKIGMRSTAIVGIDADPIHLLKIGQKLKALPEVKYVALTTGDHMLMIEIWSRDGQELSTILLNRIASIEGVKKVCPSMVLEKLKG